MTGPELEGLIKRIQAVKPDVLKLAQSAMDFKKKQKKWTGIYNDRNKSGWSG
jgi:hypothetical protein